MAQQTYRPGQKSKSSQQYEEFGPRGGFKKEVQVNKNKIFPPTELPGGYFVPVDAAKNKSGRGK